MEPAAGVGHRIALITFYLAEDPPELLFFLVSGLMVSALERMKGRAKVKSQEGQGSCFWIELPLAEV